MINIYAKVFQVWPKLDIIKLYIEKPNKFYHCFFFLLYFRTVSNNIHHSYSSLIFFLKNDKLFVFVVI